MNPNISRILCCALLGVPLFLIPRVSPGQEALKSSISFQARLNDSGIPASGTHDFKFKLFDDETTGTEIATEVVKTGVTLDGGLATTNLDFGARAFNTKRRWVEIHVKKPGDSVYTKLSPRKELTAVPYALSAKPAVYNVLLVAPSGGDFTSVQQALDSITDASASNRYVVRIAPGTYTGSATMKPFVDIEGSGEGVTVLTGPGSSGTTTGTLIGASNAEVRHLTVRNTGGAAIAIAIFNNGTSPRLTHVTAEAKGATAASYGVYNFSPGAPTLTDVTASAEVTGGNSSVGIACYGAAASMTRVTAKATGGVTAEAFFSQGATFPVARDCSFTASGATSTNTGLSLVLTNFSLLHGLVTASGGITSRGVSCQTGGGTGYTARLDATTIIAGTAVITGETGYTVRLGACRLDGGNVVAGGATVTCAGCYDENYTFAAGPACP